MSSFIRVCALGALLALPVSNAAVAHHSFAMFDETRSVNLTGTIAKVNWSNPHVVFWLITLDSKQKATVWTIESPFGPGGLKKYGWTKDTLKVGDKVGIWISPLRDGKSGGSLQSITFLATGKTMYDGSRGEHGGLDRPGAQNAPK